MPPPRFLLVAKRGFGVRKSEAAFPCVGSRCIPSQNITRDDGCLSACSRLDVLREIGGRGARHYWVERLQARILIRPTQNGYHRRFFKSNERPLSPCPSESGLSCSPAVMWAAWRWPRMTGKLVETCHVYRLCDRVTRCVDDGMDRAAAKRAHVGEICFVNIGRIVERSMVRHGGIEPPLAG